MRSTRIAILFLAALGSLIAGPVYFSAHGKTFHADPKCSVLARSHEILTADESAAVAHGLHKCARCYAEHKAAKSNASWAAKVNIPTKGMNE